MFCTASQEKADLQGWPTNSTGDLTVREFGQALGNSWSLPIATRIFAKVAYAMGWSRDVIDPYEYES